MWNIDPKNEKLLFVVWLLIAISNIVALVWLHSDPKSIGAFIMLYLRLSKDGKMQ